MTNDLIEEVNSLLLSSTDPPLWLLGRHGDRARAIRFLVEAAKCRREDKPFLGGTTQAARDDALQRLARRFPEFCAGLGHLTFKWIQDRLLSAWRAPTPGERKLWITEVTWDVVDFVEKNPEKPRSQDLSKVAWALWQLVEECDRMRCCLNENCDAPFFLARRRTQKYCSEDCAAPAVRQFKRTWWKEHGEDWRAAREKAKRKVKSRMRGKI